VYIKGTVRRTGGACLLALSGCLEGCQLPNAFPRELAEATKMIVQKVADEGTLEKWASNVEGDVFNPGVEAYVCVSSGVRLVGVQGEIDLTAGGDSTRLPSGVRDALIAQLSGPLGDQQRMAILEILGWNRTPAGGTPTPIP